VRRSRFGKPILSNAGCVPAILPIPLHPAQNLGWQAPAGEPFEAMDVQKRSWLWWLSGSTKDAEDVKATTARRQTDQSLRRQEAPRERPEEPEQKIG
jgi:hypothetical protein